MQGEVSQEGLKKLLDKAKTAESADDLVKQYCNFATLKETTMFLGELYKDEETYWNVMYLTALETIVDMNRRGDRV